MQWLQKDIVLFKKKKRKREGEAEVGWRGKWGDGDISNSVNTKYVEKKEIKLVCKDTKCVTWHNGETTLGILSALGYERNA